MKRILVIAPTYCRPDSPNGQIERHFFPRLPLNYKSTILCNERWSLKVESDNCKVARTPFNKWVNYACRFMFHTPFPHIGNVPDQDYFCWGKQAIKEAVNLAQKESFDLIHSISIPCTSHVVANEIKKQLNIPWIAQFYDPWSGNPFRVMKSPKMLDKDRILEKQVATNADLIIHPCDVMVEYWKNLFGDAVRDKLKVLPFATEIPAIEEHKHDPSRLVISHIGNFSPERNASVFIKALSKLNKNTLDKVVVNFVGNVVESDVQLVNELGLQNTVKIVGKVPESECHRYYVESDIFLIIDIDCSPNLFYPSKILKYFCYQKPILGLTTEQSVIRDELEKTGNYPFRYNDIEGVAAFLARAVSDYESILTNDKEYGSRFYTENVISEYCKLVDTL